MPTHQLTLRQAVDIALEKNPQRKAALADTRAASEGLKEARSALLPHFLFSETATAGDDPVYVFGTRLRQERFTAADFTLNALNTPLPVANFATRFGGTWNLFDSMASWRSVARAGKGQEAMNHQLERAEQEIVFHVADAYYAVQLAGKRVEVTEQAIQTAQAILDESKSRVESGISVNADALSAQVRLAERRQELVRAQDDLSMARSQLSVAIGLSTGGGYLPAGELAEPVLPSLNLEDLEKQAVERRPELKRLRAEESAQQLSVAIAKSSFGPRVNAFADWELDNPTLFNGGGGNNWVAGIEVQLNLFDGGAKRAELARQHDLQDKIAAMKQSATDGVQLEVLRAYYDVDSARQQIELARASIAAAQESLRMNRDRYDAGLSTITALLAAEDAARQAQTDYWQAISSYYTGYAALELASGTLNPQSPLVTP